MDSRDVAIVLVAAGRGVRAGGDLPKQYQTLAGRTVIARTLEAFATALPGAAIVPVINPHDRALYDAAVAPLPLDALRAPVAGGATRQDSVRAGLASLAGTGCEIVLIHDAARPFASPALIQAAVEAARRYGAAIPAVPVVDALMTIDATGQFDGGLDRDRVRAVQTPQAFAFGLIHEAHEQAASAAVRDLPDDSAVATWAGHAVQTFPGDARNVKLTTPQDFEAAQARLAARLSDVRVGAGYDVHAFGPGDHVWLGGVRIAHDAALVGHSDADVLLHALTDAILGALADGDIGSHFPPSDPRWKGAASDQFLKHAVARVAARGGMVAHLDATIICEAPKIGPHRDAIRETVARIAGLDIGRVAIKATTSERLGFTGRREGIAVQAIATVRLPMGAAE